MFACALLEKQMVVICSNLVSKTTLASLSHYCLSQFSSFEFYLQVLKG